MQIILNELRIKCTQEMRSELNILSLHDRRRFHRFQTVFKILNKLDCPEQQIDVFNSGVSCENDIFGTALLHVPRVKISIRQSMLKY